MNKVYNNDIDWPEWIEELYDNEEDFVDMQDFSWQFLNDDSNDDSNDA